MDWITVSAAGFSFGCEVWVPGVARDGSKGLRSCGPSARPGFSAQLQTLAPPGQLPAVGE